MSVSSAERAELFELIMTREESETAFCRLQQLLHADAAARQYYLDQTQLMSQLCWTIRATEATVAPVNHGELTSATSSPYLAFLWPVRMTTSRMLALGVSGLLIVYFATLMLSVIWNIAEHRLQPEPVRFATLTYAENSTWATGAGPRGDGIVAGEMLELQQGAATIEFASGAQVNLVAPVRFAASSSNSGYLKLGKLLAAVPTRAVGFTVNTPSATVLDLGTEFGILVREDGESEIAVTVGKVDVTTVQKVQESSDSSTSKRRVKAGEGIRVDARNGRFHPLDLAEREVLRTNAGANTAVGNSAAQWLVAYQAVPDGAAANQFDFQGSLGLDFNVSRPITVYSLGVFDHLGDGIDPSSAMTVQLWSRDTQETDELTDDSGVQILAEVKLTAERPGQLKFCHRFATLPKPVVLGPGAYTIVAHGFSSRNPNVNFGYGPNSTIVRSEVDTGTFAIAPVGSRAMNDCAEGVFPIRHEEMTVRYCAGSFEFETDN